MSRQAKAHMDDRERRLNQPVSPKEMEQRRQFAAELKTLWNRPMTEEEKKFWWKLDTDLGGKRLSFR